jgi:Uma2 family endonuclease
MSIAVGASEAIALSHIPTISPEEYLALEVESETRNEYRNGEIVPMTGGTPAHNKLASALNALLWFALRDQPLNLFMTDQRLWIPAASIHTYPDIMVTKDPLVFQAGRRDTLMNPVFVAEVLSDSTKAYDRTDKFAAYRSIEGFEEYLLIDQAKVSVEHYVKQSENQWLFSSYDRLDVQLVLTSLGVQISLADLYSTVDFK